MNNAWKQGLLLAAGVCAGILLAYIDSLPQWDDAGILAGSLFLLSGLLTLLGHRKPWLVALALGIWIPLRGLIKSLDFSLLLILIFPLLGAYAGSLVRSAFWQYRGQGGVPPNK